MGKSVSLPLRSPQRTTIMHTLLLFLLLFHILTPATPAAFLLPPYHHHAKSNLLPSNNIKPTTFTTTTFTSTSTTALPMIFDFFKDASADFTSFLDGLAKSRNKLLFDLENLLSQEEGDFFTNLEAILLQADIGYETTDEIIDEIKTLRETSIDYFGRDDLKSVLRGKLIEILSYGDEDADGSVVDDADRRRIQFAKDDGVSLTVLFIMGANGMGKTTTIGKLAHRLRTEGDQKIMVAACDTFRAAAVQQLESWADRANVTCFSPLVEGDSGSREKSASPSSVLYGAVDKAVKEGYDTLIVDTSGRLSNNDALTQELLKMKRVIQKRLSTERDEEGKVILNESVPQETLLVMDAAQGRMALDAARQWNKEIGLTGLILTKLDGTAKGGSVVAISRELKLPVKLTGVGEGIEDLKDFEPEIFVDALLGIDTQKNEQKELEQRLKEMRKRRDQEAAKATPAPAANEMANAAVGGGGGGGTTPANNNNNVPRKPKRKKNKSKKKKGKK